MPFRLALNHAEQFRLAEDQVLGALDLDFGARVLAVDDGVALLDAHLGALAVFEALSRALYRIPKTVEKFGERYEIMHHLVKPEYFAPQMAIAQEAAAVVVRMVDMLPNSPKLEDIKAENDMMQELEGRADALVLSYLKEIYSGSIDPIKAMAMRDLYDLLEKVIDRCRDACNVVSQIVLKNS